MYVYKKRPSVFKQGSTHVVDQKPKGQKTSTPDPPSRACNGLEALFVACNIRFAAGVTFPPVAIDTAQRCLSAAAQALPNGRLEVVVLGPDGTPHLQVIEPCTPFEMEHVPMPVMPTGAASGQALAQALGDFVDSERPLPAHGALRFRLMHLATGGKISDF